MTGEFTPVLPLNSNGIIGLPDNAEVKINGVLIILIIITKIINAIEYQLYIDNIV